MRSAEKMTSYNVFFSPKEGTAEAKVLDAARRFLEELQLGGHIRGYRLLRVTSAGSFTGLPRFQAIVDYASEEELDASFVFMRYPGRMTNGPHGELISLVSDFRVSFTVDV